MNNTFTKSLDKHISFDYTSFDRVVLRGYIQNLFVPGSVITLLRNLGFNKHSNGVMKVLTDQFNSHIKKTANKLNVNIHWWGKNEKHLYHSKIDLIKDIYSKDLNKKNKKSKIIAIIKSLENSRTFTSKEINTKAGNKFTKMFTVNKFVSQYYIYINDHQLGLCYLKISSYLPFMSEFYFNGHNYLQKQFDLNQKKYTKNDNSFTFIQDLDFLNSIVKQFKPSIALNRIKHWMNLFFKFDKGAKSTRSKLLSHNWFTFQTEIATNIIFKSPKFANSYFKRILAKHHTIGLPDKLTEIFSLSKLQNNSKSTQNKFNVKAVLKHFLEKNSIKLYNKNGCLLRVETTINKPDLPGLKLMKPAINLMAYYWFGFGCNSRYLDTVSDIDISLLDEKQMLLFNQPFINDKGYKIAAPDLRKEHQIDLLKVLISSAYQSFGFRSKDLKLKLENNWKTAKIAYELRKLRVRGAVEKLQNTHYYRLTKKGFIWIFYSFFNSQHLVKPLLSASYILPNQISKNNRSEIEKAYADINSSLSLITSAFKIVP